MVSPVATVSTVIVLTGKEKQIIVPSLSLAGPGNLG